MKRREALVKISWILRSAILAPSVLTVLQSCQKEIENSTGLMVFNSKQNKLVRAISDIIIPRTTTPSASDVKVDKFIDLLLKDVFSTDVTQNFLYGLDQFDKDCKASTGENFIELSKTEQHTYLEKIDKDIMSKYYDKMVPFYYTIKTLVITSYFSTEQGVQQNLNYNPIPGAFKGDIELNTGDKILIGNLLK